METETFWPYRWPKRLAFPLGIKVFRVQVSSLSNSHFVMLCLVKFSVVVDVFPLKNNME